MKKLVWFALVASLMAGCSSRRQFVIYNGCKGSWVYIQEGSSVIVDRLEYGQSAGLETSRFLSDDGRTVELVAVGHSLKDGHPMGSTTRSIYVSGRSGSFTAPSDLPTWEITSLYDSASGNGCEAR